MAAFFVLEQKRQEPTVKKPVRQTSGTGLGAASAASIPPSPPN